MRIVSLQFLADILSDRYAGIRHYGRCEHGFRGVRVLRNDMPPLSAEYCYICDPEYISGKIDSSFSYILCGQNDERFSGTAHIVIPGDRRVYAVCDRIQDLFDWVQDWMTDVQTAISRGDGVQQILELSSEMFRGCPMIVTSPSLMILGYMKNEGTGASEHLRSIIFGKDYLQHVPGSRNYVGLERPQSHRYAYMDETELNGVEYRVLRNNLYSHDGVLLGRLTISQDNSVLRQYHIPLSIWLSEQLSTILTQNIADRAPMDNMTQELLVKALTERVLDEKAVRQICSLNEWERDSAFQLICFNLDEIRTKNSEILSNMDFAFAYIFPHSRTVVVDRCLVLILPTPKNYLLETFRSWFQEYVKENDLSCGCSEVMKNFENASLLYHQAVFALENSWKGKIVFYQDVLSGDILSHFAGTYGSSAALLEPVKRLARYDGDHSSELVRTLLAYLLCDRSHEKCSTLLNIHRSTLRYRLGQIREVGELSLDDMTPVKKLNLILSLSAAVQRIDIKNA